jgi:hypothetical protein
MTTTHRPPHVAKQAVDRVLAKRQETGAGEVGDKDQPEVEAAAVRDPWKSSEWEEPAPQEPAAEAPSKAKKPDEPEPEPEAPEEPAPSEPVADEPAAEAASGRGAYFIGNEINVPRPRSGVERLVEQDVTTQEEAG